MAIVVEEEKQVSGTPAFLGWIVAAAIIGAGVYYIFFAAPPSVMVTPPANLQLLNQLGAANLDPTTVLNNPDFQALKASIPEPTSTGPGRVGRQNPFVAP